MWEKTKLKDFFRLYFKIFAYDTTSRLYYILPVVGFEEWFFNRESLADQAIEHEGYSLTGVTVN